MFAPWDGLFFELRSSDEGAGSPLGARDRQRKEQSVGEDHRTSLPGLTVQDRDRRQGGGQARARAPRRDHRPGAWAAPRAQRRDTGRDGLRRRTARLSEPEERGRQGGASVVGAQGARGVTGPDRDPVALEVFRNLFYSVAEERGVTRAAPRSLPASGGGAIPPAQSSTRAAA